MAIIKSVDYDTMMSQSSSMREQGKDLNSEFTSAYTSIANMHDCWYGQRYNVLASAFNDLIDDVNAMLNLVIDEIPFALATIANNYSQADKGVNAGSATNETPNAISPINITNDTGMRFLTSDVQSVQARVNSNIENAIEDMNSIESLFNEIDWQSEAASTFRNKFNSLKSSICNSLENLKADFKDLMDKAQSDVQTAETNNTVS